MVLIKYSNLTTTAMKQFLTAIALALLLPLTGLSAAEPSFRALVLTERGGQHESFTAAALEWLDGFSQENNFTYEEINSPRDIDSAFLARFKVFIQLDYPPYNWPDKAKAAFEQAIFDGTIGWVGFHHATLLGDFDGFPMWQWFSDFMGGIRSGVNGATALPGLYAVGETCCNGVHGKNRLASNSLLESLLFAKRAAQDINARYCPADMSAATAAEAALDLSVYANSTKLLREYKEIIRAAIDSENAACAAREGETKA